MIIEGNLAAASVSGGSRLPDLLEHVRTPLDILCALADDGAEHGFDLWVMAAVTGGTPTVAVCSTVPLAPAILNGQLAHFLSSVAETPIGTLLPTWADARQQVVCLHPNLPPLEQGLAEYRDTQLATGDPSGVVIRAASLGGPDGGHGAPDWARLTVMMQYVAPVLRALDLAPESALRGMIDAESGVYSWSHFVDAMEREVERARRYDTELSLAVLDLKHRKMMADIPSEAHRRVGEHLLASVRRSDLVGRVGRRSYAVFLHNTGPRPGLIAAGRIADALKGDEMLASLLTFSLGVSGWEAAGPLEVSTLLAQAGEAAAEAALVAPGSAFVYV